MRRRARLIRWIALPIILGAATTIAVSWSLAAWLPQRNWPQTVIHDRPLQARYTLSLSEYRTTGAVRRAWVREIRGMHRLAPFLIAIDNSAALTQPNFSEAPLRRPRWGVTESVRADPLAFPEDGLEHATGWPVVAGWYSATVSYSHTGETLGTRGGIYLKPRSGSISFDASTFRALPLRPIWPGIIINTAFYAVLWLLPLGALRATKRAWRRRRGRCRACAYDLAGLAPAADNSITCPECGRVERGNACSGRRG